MSYSDFGNEVHNGAISITKKGFNIHHFNVNQVGQWGKIPVMAMIHYLKNKEGVVDFANAQGLVMF